MTTAANTIQTNSLAALASQAPSAILSAIKRASTKTGVDFAYMLHNASAESGFDAAAKSVTSTATGLYQFVDKTWLNLVKKYGAQVGLGHYANEIDAQGNVASAAAKKQILALRKDPSASAMMAAEYTSENKAYLQENLPAGTTVGPTELNLAHFLGAGGATEFLKAYQANPVQQASDLFPKAANANHNVFYDSKTGAPRTLAGIYDFFAQKVGATGDTTNAALVATAGPTATSSAASSSAAVTQLANDLNTSANATASLLYQNGAGSTMLANHEMVHWFTARQLPADTTTATVATAEPTALTANPADIALLSQARDAYAAYSQRQYAARAYAGATS